VPLDTYDIISARPEVSIIGHISKQETGCRLILSSGSEVEITAQGWNALKDQQ
jgi:thiamine-monophosphate kinase